MPLSMNMAQRLILFLFAAFTFFLIFIVSLKHTSGDFDVYYDASRNYLNSAPVYVPHQGIDEFKYSPLFALFFSPLTLMPRIVAIYVWTISNVILFYAIFYLLYQLKQISFNNFKDFFIILLLFSLMGRFVFSDFKLGQVNVLLCFLMVSTMYFEINKKYFLASIVLAFSLMIKFFPLLFVLYFLFKRRFKLVAYTFLMVIIFLLLPSIYSGFHQNSKYLHDWFVLLRSTPPTLLYSVKNNSLLSYFSWLFIARHEAYTAVAYLLITKGLTSAVYLAWGMSCVVLFVLFFYDIFAVRTEDSKFCYLDYSCLFVCGLLFNPLSYLNALVFLIIPYIVILRYLFYGQLRKKYAFISGSFILLSFILMIMDNSRILHAPDQFEAFVKLKPLMWAVILVYLSLWSAKLSLKLES